MSPDPKRVINFLVGYNAWRRGRTGWFEAGMDTADIGRNIDAAIELLRTLPKSKPVKRKAKR